MANDHVHMGSPVRICAHRGLSSACPENTLPSFGAAIAVGADEIEFDLWLSRDGVPVVCHDATVDRTAIGAGRISELDWPDICRLDAGAKLSPAWRGVRIPRIEELVDLAAGRVGLNIHIKEAGRDNRLVRFVCDTIRTRELLKVAYIAGDETVLRAAFDYAPEVSRACLHASHEPLEQIRTAVKYRCHRIQFNRNRVAIDHIRRAHEEGLICNLFWSDDCKDALEYAYKGIDVVLTNCAHQLIGDGIRNASMV